ncbi:MAG: ABC transporter permease, partial [Oscillospiraceae bacterium]|nr:ABC transporter permease [Oscillospiraceae bacterium]
GTGMRVIKMSPVQAISQRSNTVKKVRRFSLFGLIFGWTGKIASRNNMRQPKRFVATVVSLTLSIALFSAVTVVTTNIQSGAEEYYSKEEADFTNDFCEFSIVIYTEDDRLGYRDILNKIEGSNLFGEVYSERKEYGDWVFPDGVTIEDVGYGRAYISYYNRDYYNFIFGGDPPVSYDELTESGGYILTNKVLGDHTGDSISVEMDEGYQAEISEEQYLSLTPEEQAKYTEFYVYGADETKPIKRYEFVSTVICNFDIYRKISNPTIPNNELIGTLDMYENGEYKLFESLPNHYSVGIDCNLADDDKYFEAIEFFESNGIGYFDNTAERRQMNAVLSSVNILATFFSILIALIAVVNMVNILATGILNRRGELAAMQCVGMTEKQLYKMTAVECLQYALTSGILAMGVCELLMYLTEKMLNVVIEITEKFVEYISYSQALPIIGIASLCAFIIAIAASVIPLRAMRRTSLVEQIRSVE